MIAGPVTIYILAHNVNPIEQGFYYTFGSILGLKVFFELGIGNVILLAASHEKARLSWTSKRFLKGDRIALERAASIFRKASQIYLLISLLVPLLIFPIGIYFFTQSEDSHRVAWHGPWILLCLLTAFNLWSSFITSFLEGCGMITEISKLRLRVSVISSLISWTVLTLGGSLYAAASTVAADLACVGLHLILSYRKFIWQLFTTPITVHSDRFSWKNELWPMQWRMAISFVSGYFMFQLFNPIVFHYCGAKEAGRMGMTINLVSVALTASMAWINTKASTFGSLISSRNWVQLDYLFFKTTKQSFSVLIAAMCGLLCGYLLLNQYISHIAERLLPLVPLFFLLIATAGNHLLFSMTLYLRAHREDPFVMLSVVSGGLISGLSLISAPVFGTYGMTFFYALITWTVGVGWGTTIFQKRRKKLHI